MIMPIPGGLQACKEKCNSVEDCTAFEYALTTYDDSIDCCVLRKCPLPVPTPELTQAEWHDGNFDYVGYAKRKIKHFIALSIRRSIWARYIFCNNDALLLI